MSSYHFGLCLFPCELGLVNCVHSSSFVEFRFVYWPMNMFLCFLRFVQYFLNLSFRMIFSIVWSIYFVFVIASWLDHENPYCLSMCMISCDRFFPAFMIGLLMYSEMILFGVHAIFCNSCFLRRVHCFAR